jgi:uncharacterized protein (TIGR02246 family)
MTSSSEARLITEIDRRWIAAFNAGDVETIVSLYAHDVVVMPPGEPSLHGRDAVRRWLESFFESYTARQHLVNDEIVVAGPWAWMRGHFTLVVERKDAPGKTRQLGKHLVIWRREGEGAWLAARDIWNLDLPATPGAGS